MVKNYIEVLKPKESFLHTFISICAIILATEGCPFLDSTRFIFTTVAIILGCCGANGLTNYLDREIDARMKRTSHRALPSKQIHPPEKVLPLVTTLIITFLVLSWYLHPLCFLVGVIGVLAASLLRKKVTCVFQGAISSCAPVLVGYLAFKPHFDVSIIVLCLLIIIWVPLHVWSVMIAYRDDFRQANITYFPITWEPKDAVKVLLFLSILLYSISVVLWYVAQLGWFFFFVANIAGFLMTYANVRLVISSESKQAWKVYKLSAFPYLGLIFLAMCLTFWI